MSGMSSLQPDNTRLDSAAIAQLVDCFYDKVRQHPVIGPVFNDVVRDWPAHKQRLTAFWCSVALRAGTYHGNPMAVHRALPIQGRHFDQWLTLWRATCNELLSSDDATRMIGHAENIGRGLRLGMGLPVGASPFPLPVIGSLD